MPFLSLRNEANFLVDISTLEIKATPLGKELILIFFGSIPYTALFAFDNDVQSDETVDRDVLLLRCFDAAMFLPCQCSG